MRNGVAIKADSAFYETLPFVFSHWPYEISDHHTGDIFAEIVLAKARYTLSSPFMSKAESYREPVNALCALVAEVAWARLREDPTLLCLHGAAAEFSGRLVAFPATRRAGKSTLTVALAAQGLRIFSDDFLPISISSGGEIRGISSGVSPRLRRPHPKQIGKIAKGFMARRRGVQNAQYRYVSLLDSESARFGEAAPLGAVVFLSREAGATAELRKIDKAEALKTLIYQNFSRAGNAGDILAMLDFIAAEFPVYFLIYDEAEPAIAQLKAQFSTWPERLPCYAPKTVLANEVKNGLKPFRQYRDVRHAQFKQAADVRVVSTDGKRFLTGRNGQSIHYLNEGAALIWQILSEPASADEAVEILAVVFPEQDRAEIQRDVHRCFSDFGKNGLLERVGPGPESG